MSSRWKSCLPPARGGIASPPRGRKPSPAPRRCGSLFPSKTGSLSESNRSGLRRRCANGKAPPGSWDAWRAADRCRPLLAPGEVPWRATYWPRTGRFLWTFHHALLDGRSITAILIAFLARISGEPAEDLALAKWQPPNADALALADRMFREDFPHPSPERLLPRRRMKARHCGSWVLISG